MILTLKLITTQKARLGSDNAPLTDSLDFYRKDYALPPGRVKRTQDDIVITPPGRARKNTAA